VVSALQSKQKNIDKTYPQGYGWNMEIRKTETFARWLDRLKDPKAKAKVRVRITRLAASNITLMENLER